MKYCANTKRANVTGINIQYIRESTIKSKIKNITTAMTESSTESIKAKRLGDISVIDRFVVLFYRKDAKLIGKTLKV